MPERMVKIGKDGAGITVEGEDYKDFLARKEKKEKEDEAETERKKEIGTKTKHKKKVRPRERFEDDPARVSKRVRHLSPFEIRKEYGVKERPFPTLNQNVLFALFNAGDALINSRAISVEIGKPLADTSSALSHIWNKLKDTGMIYRKRVGLAYQYCMTNDALAMGFEPLFRKYWKSTPVKVREIITPGERTGPYAHGALPYKRTSKNVIELISRSMGEEFLAREIAEGVGKPPANISSTLQMVIKRLQPHGMIDLMGSRATRSYKLHPGLAHCKGEDLIEFIQSPKKYYEKPRDHAWAFWDKRLALLKTGKEPVEPEPPAVEDPRLKGAYKYLMEQADSMFKRIEALEEDGLGEQVENLHKIHQGIRREFEQFKTGISSDIKDIFDLENKAPGEFNINFNVRFLFGG